MNSSGEPRELPSPSSYREQNPYDPAPPDYEPPSMLAEHKGLAILFAAILIGFAGYGWKTLNRPARHAAPAAVPSPDAASSAQPIYIEAVPE